MPWTEADAYAALATVPGVGRRSLEAVRSHFGSFARALESSLEQVASAASLGAIGAGRALRQAGDLRHRLAGLREGAVAAGATLLTALDAAWPERLAEIADLEGAPESEAPTSLYVRGAVAPLERRFSAAVVGSRRPDGLARAQVERIAAELAEAGVAVVSGGAAGVDTLAHEAALAAGGHTVAVLGTGIDVAYPPRNRDLYRRIVEAGGALVTEYGPGTRPDRGLFPKRNRIISGLADVIVVVAAAPGSGALITVRHGRAQGRTACAVPGDPRRPLSAGPNRVLVEGGAAVLEGADVVRTLLDLHEPGLDGGNALTWLGERTRGNRAGAVATGLQLPLSEAARRLLGRLEPVPHTADRLAAEAGLNGAQTAAALAELEVAGLAERMAGGYVLAAPGPGTGGKDWGDR